MKKWPTLYEKAKNGKIKTWQILVDTLYGEVAITTKHGYEDGELITHSKTISKGKNIGKSNETTPYQQAVKEAEAKYKKQLDKGYVDKKSAIGSKISYLPMLAIKYDPKKHNVSNGIYLQPKLNGVRCVAVKKDGQVKLYSRLGKDYTKVNDSLAEHMNNYMFNDEIWDGEIYVHGWEFQRIISAVKKKRNDTELLEYHRYDLPSIDREFKYRWAQMKNRFTSKRIKQVHTIKVDSDFDVKMFHNAWVRQGYEGVIIRDPDAKYMWNHRDKALLKYKEFQDEEFLIIGYYQGTGTDSGAIVWKCRGTRKDGTNYYFHCRPRGTIEDRRILWQTGWRYVGKMLTVRFQERSMDDVPIFPVGIAIRDYE